ncbi:MAG TPA: methyl-accepting chemotaxis protein [Gemmatimonadaceae bacterium]|nr:methyl-accepting chemotaxis protein [Gemmatimonadaceae bacterium]
MANVVAPFSTRAADRLRDLTLVGKLSLTMAALLLTLAGVIGMTMVSTRASIARHTGDLVDARRVKEMAILSLALLRSQDDMSKAMLLDPDRMDSLGVAKVEAYDESTALLTRMDSLSTSADLRRLTLNLRAVDEERLRALDTRILELTAAGDAKAATRLYFSEYEPVRAEYERLVEELGVVAEAHAENAARRVASANRRALTYISIALTAGIALVSFGLYGVARKVGTKLREAVDLVDGVARGNLTRAVHVDALDETGRMATSVNAMIRDLRRMIGEIKTTSTRLVSSSSEISTAAGECSSAVVTLGEAIEQISSGAQDQATVTNETVAVVKQMSSSIEDVVHQAVEMAKAGNHTVDIARRGGETVRAAIQGMDSTRHTVLDAAARVKELAENSARIRDINKTVSAIADQCNLLALNASIEAARAGDHGAAFRIVADEIRDLANESMVSSERIGQLLAAVQTGMADVMAAMQLGTSTADDGAHQARTAEESLEEIMRTLEGTNGQLQRIAERAHLVTGDVAKVASLVESVAAVAQQSAASAEEMSAQSVQVAEAIERIAKISSNGQDALASDEETLPIMARKLDRLIAGFEV